MKQGKVYLIGAGPGDPELVTVKGVRCLEEADTVIYDRLVDERLLSLANRAAEVIYAGKGPGERALAQEEINDLMVSRAREGKVVARLKGGDPFVLGRGGEEAEALSEQGIPFEVVPGVTAAIAVPAYAGIPLTHRRLASSFTVVTGHEDPAKPEAAEHWGNIASAADTLVLLMGVENLPQITARLREHRPATTPAALIRWGSYPHQQTITGTLADIAGKAAGLTSPAVLVVGEVVGLRHKLRWFDNRPLFGKRVLVTRPRKQSNKLSQALSRAGAQPVELPAIDIQPAPPTALDEAISRLSSYAWIVFTSVNGAEAFFSRLSASGRDARSLGMVRICAIGQATAEAVRGYGLLPDLVPGQFSTRGILEAFKDKGIAGCRVLLPRTEAAPAELAEGLQALGAEVETVAAYFTLPAAGDREEMKRLVAEADITTFTSASTVHGLLALLDGDPAVVNHTTVACIGPVTAAAAGERGIRVDVMASPHTIPALVAALVEYERKKLEGVRDENHQDG